MKHLLICPDPRAEVAFLARHTPLSNVPFLGQTLLNYWLSHLALAGASEVLVLAHDRPEQVEAVVGAGERWGLAAKVVVESRELTTAQALLKYAAELEPAPGPGVIMRLDHFPGLPEYPLFSSYSGWFKALCQAMPRALTPDRVGVREVSPGIWVGVHSQVSAQASLSAPCWIGEHVYIGERAVVGPGSVVENGAFIEPEAELTGGYLGPDTLLGRYARLRNAIALGNTIIHLRDGAVVQVANPFLLSAIRQPQRPARRTQVGRLVELFVRNKEEIALVWRQLVPHK